MENCHAIVTPLHKSGDKDDEENYRPNSVLPVLSKIMEKAVNLQVVEFLENNTVLSSNHFGYRKERSTELATALLLDQIDKEANNGNLIGKVFIDLSKAFDTLGHSRPFAILKAHVF